MEEGCGGRTTRGTTTMICLSQEEDGGGEMPGSPRKQKWAEALELGVGVFLPGPTSINWVGPSNLGPAIVIHDPRGCVFMFRSGCTTSRITLIVHWLCQSPVHKINGRIGSGLLLGMITELHEAPFGPESLGSSTLKSAWFRVLLASTSMLYRKIIRFSHLSLSLSQIYLEWQGVWVYVVIWV
jgi:hypothetical protein